MARRLAAVMFTDLANYPAMSQADEAGALRLLRDPERLVRPTLELHHGRKVKSIGDGMLVEFPDALDAVECAVELQRRLHEHNTKEGARPLQLRVGIHLGDVQRQGTDILGDAVNIASRLEPLADPGGVCQSEQVYAQVRHRVACRFEGLGARLLKGISEPVGVYRVVLPWASGLLPAPQGVSRRLAVLPLTNISPDPSDEFFADGLTEELISTISKVRDLGVISRTSVMQYKGHTKHVAEIGRELGVDSILEGSVRKAGSRIRVAVQLIDAGSDRHLWAERYDRDLDDIFEVQSDIARQVAEALRVRILHPEKERIEKRPTESVEAYTLYLKGIYQRSMWTPRAFGRAIEFLTQACQQDPAFALAYARVAECYVLIADQGVSSAEAIPKAKEYASRALSLDDSLVEAFYAQAMIANQFDWDWARAEDSFQRALSLNPSLAEAHNYYSWFLVMRGRPAEAISEADRACELDPMSPPTLQLSGFVDWIAGEYERARALFRRKLELAPGDVVAHQTLAFISVSEGKFPEAVREVDEATRLSGDVWSRQLQAQVYAMTGRKESARRALNEILSGKSPGHPSAAQIGAIYYMLGEKDKGWEWMQKAYEARDTVLAMFNRNLTMQAAREDPRVVDLLKRIGLE